ncbi:neuromedin-U receptor 2-like [Apostichopus japonicus]|uniref:neuromedin-U receptor 2-like n=1 Tax=Stichopus japonicus TaxID=307972 RepID=UPI003AB45588
MHSTLYYFLFQLALVDASVLALAYSQRLVTHLITPFKFTDDAFGGVGCFVGLMIDMLYYASLIIVTTVSMERYLAICHPLWHMKNSSNSRIVKIFILTWLFSFTVIALQLPQRFRNQVHCIIYPDNAFFDDYPPTARLCTAVVPWYRTIFDILKLVVFYTCLFISIYCYGKVIFFLSKRAHVGNYKYGEKSSESRVKADAQTSATRMILVNGSVYFFCNAPIQLYLTLRLLINLFGLQLQFNDDVLVPLFTTLQILAYINSAINPIIYSVTNARYRSAVMQTFGCVKANTTGKQHTLLTKTSKM